MFDGIAAGLWLIFWLFGIGIGICIGLGLVMLGLILVAIVVEWFERCIDARYQ